MINVVACDKKLVDAVNPFSKAADAKKAAKMAASENKEKEITE